MIDIILKCPKCGEETEIPTVISDLLNKIKEGSK